MTTANERVTCRLSYPGDFSLHSLIFPHDSKSCVLLLPRNFRHEISPGPHFSFPPRQRSHHDYPSNRHRRHPRRPGAYHVGRPDCRKHRGAQGAGPEVGRRCRSVHEQRYFQNSCKHPHSNRPHLRCSCILFQTVGKPKAKRWDRKFIYSTRFYRWHVRLSWKTS